MPNKSRVAKLITKLEDRFKIRLIHNNRIAEMWGHDGWTLGQRVYYNDAFAEDLAAGDIDWVKHEAKHAEQWHRYWYIGFLILYQYYRLRYGYKNNPLEIEAREAERVPY